MFFFGGGGGGRNQAQIDVEAHFCSVKGLIQLVFLYFPGVFTLSPGAVQLLLLLSSPIISFV